MTGMLLAVRKLLGGALVAAITVVMAALGLFEGFELIAFDELFVRRGVRAPRAPIVIVSVGEESFQELDHQWPFPRSWHAQLLDRIRAGGPIAVGIDIVFDTPSAMGPAEDRALGDAVARAGNVVLAAAPNVVVQQGLTREDANFPLAVIRRGAAAVGPVNHFEDPDGHVRRAALRHRLGGEAILAFDAQLHRLVAAAGVPAAPLPNRREILIDFRGAPQTFPWVPYYQVMRGEAPPELFRGKIVLIGATSPLLHDTFATAFAHDMPGIEIHANVLETLLRGDRIHPAPAWLSIVTAMALAVIAAWFVARLRALRAFLAVIGVGVAVAAVTFVAFVAFDVWLRAVAVLGGLLFGYIAAVTDNFVREQREKRRLSQFFSPAVLREIVRHQSDALLHSERRLLTVLFSDIRGFTALSENAQPEEVAGMLSDYLSELTEVVFRHNGTVDKYIGDCIMALYNVPFEDSDHAVNAVRTALEFQERVAAVSAKWQARLGVTVRNGVGINTGEAVVGALGSRQRREYTAIGDTVNLASRLESATKDHGASIIMSETTHALVKGQFLTRALGSITVKGRAQAVRIYTVVAGDSRAFPRRALAAAATVTAAGGATATMTTRDISAGGTTLVGAPEEWGVGTKLDLSCAGDWLPETIVAQGSIVWRRAELAGVAFSAELADPSVLSVAAPTTVC